MDRTVFSARIWAEVNIKEEEEEEENGNKNDGLKLVWLRFGLSAAGVCVDRHPQMGFLQDPPPDVRTS